jgi:molecular chaperone GrpE
MPEPDRERRQAEQETEEQEEAEAAAPVEADLDELTRIAAERDEYRDALQRLQADFENYRKRVLRQQTEHLERAAQDLVEKLLEVLDTFDLALAHGEGLEQGHQALVALLEKEGLERVGAEGEPFDPTRHDAVAHEPGEAAAGPEVAEVLRAGYRWKGRMVRPAMVRARG